MNITVVRNAIGGLDKLLSEVRTALWQIEDEVFGSSGRRYDGGMYEYPQDALEGLLVELHDLLLVVLEAAEMPETRASLVGAWGGFTSEKQGLRHTKNNGLYENCESPAMTFLQHVIHGLRMSVSDGISSEDAWTLSRLEAMLRDTPALVHRRGRRPADELELQEIMHDYVSACFADYRQDPKIGGALKAFKPDCGIASVGAAIEFKIVHNKDQMAVAFSGVAEDTAGYKGSKDWTRFYAVIYQAQPFILESHLRSDLKRIGAATWIPIVVNGPTKEKAPKKATADSAGSKKKSV